MALAVSKASRQYQTSVIINNKIDEGNNNNKINKENDKPIIESNDFVRSNEDSPPLKPAPCESFSSLNLKNTKISNKLMLS
jgi:hypothetical protein